MIKGKLKLLRVSFEILFFVFIILSFFRFFPGKLKVITLKTQIIPLLISFLSEGFFLSLLLLVLFLLLTVIFGRIYCSFFCPLGGFQDILIRIKRKIEKKTKFNYHKSLIPLKLTILTFTIISLISGSLYLIGYLDPYSFFGKIVNYLLKPVIIIVNNGGELMLRKVNIYALHIMTLHTFNPLALTPFILVLGIIIYFSLKRGRLYCNSICPLGTFLGIFSIRCLYRIEIDKSSCTSCGICESVCKAECINSKDKTVDNSFCVRCFNCLNACTFSAIKYKPSIKKKKTDKQKTQNLSRRNFLYSFLGVLSFSGINLLLRSKKQPIKSYLPPPTPPGSISLEEYISKCTACYLCVNNCPTNVLQPSLFQYGLKGVFIPYMDFYSGYCDYECTQCLDVCPTNAIIPHTIEEKKKIQIGRVKFIKDFCVVYRNNTNCGACAEICPTAAVTMTPYKGFLLIPTTTPSFCIGCGACQNVCPARPEKAIVVETNIVHKEAKKPKRKRAGQQKEITEDFPF
jgi:ferredoxin